MKPLVIVGLTLVAAACSGGREQRAPETTSVAQQPDLTLPDTVTRKDSSVTTLSSADVQPKSRVARHVTESLPAKPAQPTTARRHPRAAVQTPKKQQEDTSVQGYAPTPGRAASNPGSVSSRTNRADSVESADSLRSADSLESIDSSKVAVADTSAAQDTVSESEVSTVPPDTSAKSADTVRPAQAARAPARVADSTPSPAPDTASSAPAAAPSNATAAPVRDTTVPTSASSPDASDLAARTLPIGTEIHAALDDSITSRRDTVGHQVSGHVMENVLGLNGHTLIAAGTPVRFTITQIRPSRSKSSHGRLALRADGLALAGQLRPVKADIANVPQELRGRGVTTSEAAKVGGGAAAGAVIGGVVGKTKGAVIGGVAGAAAGAVVASQTATRDVVVKAKTPVVLVLTAPLVAP